MLAYIILIKNRATGSLVYLLKNTNTIIAPVPYIGQYGPLKNPRSSNFPLFHRKQYIISHKYPKTEYTKYIKNILAKLYSNSILIS
ncbi:hypothetical protein D3C73_847330 [compost metagenome]